MINEPVKDAIDSLLEKGLIACVGFNEAGEEMYTTMANALEKGMTIYPSLEQTTEPEGEPSWSKMLRSS